MGQVNVSILCYDVKIYRTGFCRKEVYLTRSISRD